MTTKQAVRLGNGGPVVFPLALGCMGMGRGSWYGASDEAESIATIHEAVEHGVNVLDTGDFYGMGKNEMLVGKAVHDRRDKVLLSVKYGAQRGPDGSFLGNDCRPAATKNALAHSLSRLGVDHIDIYRPARLDPNVPIEDTIGAIADMVQAGYVRYIGLSEVGPETIRRAARVHPICDLQIEYALVTRNPENAIIPALRELGIAMTAYGVLSRGLLTGAKPVAKSDVRAHMPRFAEENAQQNAPLVETLGRIAAEKGVTPAQLAIAWVVAKASSQRVSIVPTMGARSRNQLREALSGLDVALSEAEMKELETAVPASQVAGSRYPEAAMATLDSER